MNKLTAFLLLALTLLFSAPRPSSAQNFVWELPTDLSAVGQSADRPQIALSADGTRATAVWYRSNGTNILIQAASATISGSTARWSSVTDLSAAGQNADRPEIALSADGTRATAVWYRSNGTNLIIQAASATISGNTATWSSVTDLSAAGRDAVLPQIALSADGSRATAVWNRSNGTHEIIQAASATISGNTATWSSVIDIADTQQLGIYPGQQIALSADGTRATAVWVRGGPIGTNDVIQAASATISGNTATWSSATDLSADGQNAANPQIALSEDGTRATSVWYRFNGMLNLIQAASATISGNTVIGDNYLSP